MDFVILKVNGKDLSGASHEETVTAFHTAEEPIIVEVLKRKGAMSRATMKEPAKEVFRTSSVATQTESLVSNDTDFHFRAPSPPPLISFEDVHEENGVEGDIPAEVFDPSTPISHYDVEYEEILLHKTVPKDRIGLTLFYGMADEDGVTDIFIGEIESNSVAGRDGRIREGDQILQINSTDVRTREEAIRLFAESRSDISLLVCRPCVQDDDGFAEDIAHSTSLNNNEDKLALIEEISEAEDSTVTDTATLPSCKEKEGKDSGVGQDSAPNDESSDHEYDSSNNEYFNPERHQPYNGQEECSNFRHILEARCEQLSKMTVTHLVNPSPAHLHTISDVLQSPRVVPKMGTKLISNSCDSPPSTLNKTSPVSIESNADTAYNTAESSWHSMPLTLELSHDHHSSTLCLINEASFTGSPSQSRDGSKERRGRESSSSSSRKGKSERKLHSNRSAANRVKQSDSDSLTDVCTQLSDITYTNEENLAQTIAIQQQMLLEQVQKLPATTAKDVHSLAQSPTTYQPERSQLEWVVKRRADGSRYVTRRPVRSKLLSERKKKLEDERCGMSTDDDAMSEMKTGKYWSKEDKKKHLQKARDYRKQKELLKQKLVVVKETDETKVNLVQLSQRKMFRNALRDIDFSTVQEILVRCGKMQDTKYNLSVTTV